MRKVFQQLKLDDVGLHTPSGLMPLDRIAQATFVRNTEAEGAEAPTDSNAPGIVGGAIVGGVIAGAAGAVVGGVVGSHVTTETGGSAAYALTTSADISFAADDVAYSTRVDVFDVEAAEEFVQEVRRAAGLEA